MESESRYIDDFYAAGMRCWDGSMVLDRLKPGRKLVLAAEPSNRYDPDAVALWRKGVKLGYIPCDRNRLAAQLLRFGHEEVLECRVLAPAPEADAQRQVHVGLYIRDCRKDAPAR